MNIDSRRPAGGLNPTTLDVTSDRSMTTADFPDFFIVGAPKCGTTALYTYLSAHPGVFMPEMKEPHYFCKDFPNHQQVRTAEAYLRLFAQAPPRALRGEASVFYLFSEAAAREIIKVRPDAKFIVMLRDPVEMACSLHAQFVIGLGEDILDFEEAWRASSDRLTGKRLPLHCAEPRTIQYDSLCSFSHQIERLFWVVPKDQVKIVFYEEFFADPATHYREILRFLDLPLDERTEFKRVNSRRAPKNLALHRFVSRPPFPLDRILILLRAVSRRFNLHLGIFMHKFVERVVRLDSQELAIMSEPFKNELRDFFADDIAKLEEFLGRPLDIWRRP
jgi:hypothetical protein